MMLAYGHGTWWRYVGALVPRRPDHARIAEARALSLDLRLPECRADVAVFIDERS